MIYGGGFIVTKEPARFIIINRRRRGTESWSKVHEKTSLFNKFSSESERKLVGTRSVGEEE